LVTLIDQESGIFMGELNEARLQAVRVLLQRTPDVAVQRLCSLLARDGSDDRSLRLVRQLVNAEARDRRFKNLTFEPLAVLCKAATATPYLSFPHATPGLLWNAVKAHQPSLISRLDEAEPNADRPDTLALMDEICAAAGAGLASRATPAFAALADRLDTSPKGSAHVVTLLAMTADLRHALARAPTWLGTIGSTHAPAIRIAFRSAAEKGADAGFLFVETLFATLEQPALVLRLISTIMERPSDRFLAASELSTICERLLDTVDRHVAAVQAFESHRGLEGGVAAAAAADAATQIISEFEANLVMAREGVWGARILGQRRALNLAMEMRLREVEAAMAAALPVKMARVNGKQLRGPPNLAQLPHPPAVDKVMALAALLNGCGAAAHVTGFTALRGKVIEAQDQALEAYIQDVLDLLNKGQAPVEMARAYLDIAAELFGLVRDPKAADLVRRRFLAAAAAA
jgi:hypothetical protein